MTNVPVPRLSRLLAGMLLLLAALAAVAPSGAHAQTIENSGSWLETSAALGQGGDASGRRIRMTFLVSHPAGRELDKVAIDKDWDGTDNTATGGTIIDVTPQKPAGNFNYSRVDVTTDISDGDLGGGFACINDTPYKDRTVRARAILDNGTRSSTTVTASLRTLRGDANACNDYPYLYNNSPATPHQAVPGQSLTWNFKGDDTDAGVTSERDWTGYRWRWRRTNDGAVSGVTEVCGGNRDNTDQSITTSLPSRGHYVIEAQLAAGNGGSCNWKSEWNWVGAADVNAAAGDSPTASLSIPRPNVNQTITATANLTDTDGAPQMVEWDANGDDTYERRELGTPGLTTAQRQQAINTTGMAPGLHTVKVRVRDNGALNGADNIARTATATQTFRVDAIPVAQSLSPKTWEGDAIPVTFAATDADGDTLTYSIQTPPAHGQLTGSGTNRTYTPDAGYHGTDTIVYKVDDGFGGTTTANVNITVHPDTVITSGPPSFTSQTSATFELAPAPGLTFECKLDDGAFTPCASPQVYNSLEDGDHTLTVRGVDSAGNRDQTAATRSWTVYTGPLRTVFQSGPGTFTNQRTATFQFTSTIPGSTFTCQLDGGATEPCSTGKTYTDVEDGLHTLRVVATNGSTVESPAQSYTWTVDNIAPGTTILSGPDPDTNHTTAEIGFNSEAGATFECSLDNAPFTACTSVKQYSGLAEGEHTFAVRAIDQAGNVDPDPAVRTWNVDTTAPSATLDDAPSGDRAGDSETVLFSSADTSARMECSLDGAAFETCFSPLELNGLEDGPHTLTIRAVDAAGNTSGEQTATWTSDATVPDTRFTAGPSGAVKSPDAHFEFEVADDPAATFECKLDAGTWATCTSPQDLTDLADGAHTFSVRAKDAVGNAEVSPAVRSFTVDTQLPSISLDAAPPFDTNDTTPRFEFSSTDPGATFVCLVRQNGDTTENFVPCESPLQPTVTQEGRWEMVVRAVDAAGNLSSGEVAEWRLDTTAPSTTLATTDPSPTSSTSRTFTIGSTESGGTFECSLDGGAWQQCQGPTRTVTGLSDGEHTFEVRATDVAGNLGDVKTAFWTVDTSVPSTQIVAGPSGARPTNTAHFEFTSSKADPTFQCRLDDAATFTACGTVQTVAGKKKGVLDLSSLGEGNHTFRVKTTGTSDSAAASRTWTVDTVAPDTRIVSGPPASTSAQATFTFESEAGAAYECQLDGGAWKGCPNPHTIDIGVGQHTLQVRAFDAAGNTDPTPTGYVWTVTAPAPAGGAANGQAASTNAPNPAGAASTSCTLAGGSGCKTPTVTGKLDKRGAVQLTASGGSVALKAIDFTLPSGAALQFAKPARGKAVGTLVLTDASGKRVATHTLTLPKKPKGAATLLSKGGVKVTLKAGKAPVLKISGLPAGVVTATVKVNGGTRKLLRPAKGCTALKPTGKLTPQSGPARTLKGDAACGTKTTKKGGSK